MDNQIKLVPIWPKCKNQSCPNWLKWRENWSEIIFGIFEGPPPKKNKINKFGQHKKIKVVPNCLKWRENWSEIISGFFDPKKKLLFSQHEKKSKLSQID